jgi:ABC-type phosphate transport system permease subunit
MSLARFSISVFAAVALIAASLAGATIWLLLTDPVSVATAVTTGDVTPFVRALVGALYEVLQGLLEYL